MEGVLLMSDTQTRCARLCMKKHHTFFRSHTASCRRGWRLGQSGDRMLMPDSSKCIVSRSLSFYVPVGGDA